MDQISVIVPVYQVGEYLNKCLESLSVQNCDGIGFIIVNDGSTDGGGSIADAYAAKDKRFTVVHQPNSGVSAARNKGLELATGEYIGFVDADDWVEPDYYEKMLKIARKYDADAVFGGYCRHSDQGECRQFLPFQTGCHDAEDALYQSMRRNGSFVSIWNKLYRRDALCFADRDIHPFSSDYANGEDEVWLLEVLQNLQRVAYCPITGYHWRYRTNSASRSRKLTRDTISMLAAKERIVRLMDQHHPLLSGLARSRLYNDCFFLLILTYQMEDSLHYWSVWQRLRAGKKCWLHSSDVPTLRKAKVLLLEAMMQLHFPSSMVLAIDEIR